MLDGYEVTYSLNPLSDDADLDPDSDELSNLEEQNAGTNPKDADTDNDGMDDGWEVDNTLVPTNSADAAVDIEPDGLTNLQEYQAGTNPRVADTDADNMPDGWEVYYTLVPTNSADAAVDIEPDGLTNLREYQNGTNPRSSDTDNDGLQDGYEIDTSHTDPLVADSDEDGMTDGWEVDNALNPLVDDASLDPDNDGLTNLQEVQAGTNPQVADSDNDGMPDGWEHDNNLNPLVNDAGCDPDGDGFTNRQEYENQTSPNDVDSSQKSGYFRIVSSYPTVITDFTPDGWVSWSNSVPAGTCTIQRATSLIETETQTMKLSGDIGVTDVSGEQTAWYTYSQHSVTSVTMIARCYDSVVAAGMQYIPAGLFLMGDHFNEGYADELPEHWVYLNAYHIGKYEVTNEKMAEILQWAYDQGKVTVSINSVSASGVNLLTLNDSECRITWDGSSFLVKDTKGAGYPCIFVTWYGAAAYCNFRSEKEGLEPCYNFNDWSCDQTKNGYRLPSEAQWEKAARGGAPGFRFAWTDDNTIQHARANYWSYGYDDYDTSSTSFYNPTYADGEYPYTSPIGSFDANDYLLYDMTGNVDEWCNDWYGESYYSSSPSSNPYGPSSGSSRVVRGGHWDQAAFWCRISCRTSSRSPYGGYHSIGFRMVKPAD